MKNLAFLSALFVLPAFMASAQVVIPMKMINHQLFIPVRLSTAPGDTLNFMFDTGAGKTILDEAAATRLNIGQSSTLETTGAGGTASMKLSGNLSLLVGSFRLDSVSVLITALGRLSATMGIRMDGIIGYDLLNRYPVAIDIDRQLITIYQNEKALPAKKGKPLRFTFSPAISFFPQIKGSFTLADGRTYQGDFFMDSGAGITTLLNTPYAAAHKLNAFRGKTMNIQTEGLTAASERTIIRGATFNFSGYHFRQLPVHIAHNTAGVSAMPGIAGLLGNEFLYRFNLLLDYPGQAIYLTPNSHFKDTFDLPLCGFLLKTKDQRLLIAHVAPGSPEALSGMQDDDEVIKVNGQERLSLAEVRKMLKQQGQTLRLTLLRNGKEQAIMVKLVPRI